MLDKRSLPLLGGGLPALQTALKGLWLLSGCHGAVRVRLLLCIFLSFVGHAGLLFLFKHTLPVSAEHSSGTEQRIIAEFRIKPLVLQEGVRRVFDDLSPASEPAITAKSDSIDRVTPTDFSPAPEAWVRRKQIDDHYYTRSELDELPQLLGEIPERFPEFADQTVTGQLLLSLWIDEFGKVVRVDVSDSTLPKIFAEVVGARFGGAKFAPGRIDTRPVKSRINVIFRYEEN